MNIIRWKNGRNGYTHRAYLIVSVFSAYILAENAKNGGFWELWELAFTMYAKKFNHKKTVIHLYLYFGEALWATVQPGPIIENFIKQTYVLSNLQFRE